MTYLYAFGSFLFLLAGLAPEAERFMTFICAVVVIAICYHLVLRIKRATRLDRARKALRHSTAERYYRRINTKRKLQTA